MQIFISYSRVDAVNFAEKTYEDLSKEGHDVFIDTEKIPGGELWWKNIQKHIFMCDLFVVIVTPAALRSEWIEKEVLQAQRENKRIIPCFHKFVINEEISWNLRDYQGVDRFEDKFELALFLYKIIKENEKLIENRELRETTKAPPMSSDRQQGNEELGKLDDILKKANEMYDAKRYHEALELYNRALDVDKNNVNALNNKGLCYDRIGKFEEAIKWYDKALEVDPKYPLAPITKVLLYLD